MERRDLLVLQPQFGEVALDIGHRAGNAERLVSVLARAAERTSDRVSGSGQVRL